MNRLVEDRNCQDMAGAQNAHERTLRTDEPSPAPPPSYHTSVLPSSNLPKNKLPSLNKHIRSFPPDLQARLRLYKPRTCSSTYGWKWMKDEKVPENTVAVITNLQGHHAMLFKCEWPCRYCRSSSTAISRTPKRGYPCFDIFVDMDRRWPFEFRKVVGLIKWPTREIFFKRHWTAENLAADGQVVFQAIYSKKDFYQAPWSSRLFKSFLSCTCCCICCTDDDNVPKYIEDLNLEEFVVYK